jgi:hypothetical protein
LGTTNSFVELLWNISSSSKGKDSKIAYGVLSLIFAGLLVITVLNERKHVTVGST